MKTTPFAGAYSPAIHTKICLTFDYSVIRPQLK